jgi:predicted ATP-grasp superfamily ATP-dependent carboligase
MGSPQAFFALLAQLGIPYPKTRYRRPANADGWLAKRPGASGGGHVRVARLVADGSGYYYQRQVQGRLMSALFLANGRTARIIGISEQWNAALQARPYSYGGAVSDQPVSQRLRAELGFAIEACVAQTGLRGLNSMDLVVAEDNFQVLEINARPTATAELYDDTCGANLFLQHMQACRDHVLLQQSPAAQLLRGHLLVYAVRALRVRGGFEWPAWCSDRPPAWTRVEAGDPLCTVHASGSSRAEVHALLVRRSRAVSAALLGTAARRARLQCAAESSPCPP